MLSKENRALVESFMDAGCYRPTDTTFGFKEATLNDLLDAARDQGRDAEADALAGDMMDSYFSAAPINLAD